MIKPKICRSILCCLIFITCLIATKIEPKKFWQENFLQVNSFWICNMSSIQHRIKKIWNHFSKYVCYTIDILEFFFGQKIFVYVMNTNIPRIFTFLVCKKGICFFFVFLPGPMLLLSHHFFNNAEHFLQSEELSWVPPTVPGHILITLTFFHHSSINSNIVNIYIYYLSILSCTGKCSHIYMSLHCLYVVAV